VGLVRWYRLIVPGDHPGAAGQCMRDSCSASWRGRERIRKEMIVMIWKKGEVWRWDKHFKYLNGGLNCETCQIFGFEVNCHGLSTQWRSMKWEGFKSLTSLSWYASFGQLWESVPTFWREFARL
jgi:hypothetical protein